MLNRLGYVILASLFLIGSASAQIGGNGVSKPTSVLGPPQIIGPGDVITPWLCAGGPPVTVNGTIRGYVVQYGANGQPYYAPVC